MSEDYSTVVEDIYENVKSIGETLLEEDYPRESPGYGALEISVDIAHYLKELEGLGRADSLDFTIMSLRDGREEFESMGRYSERTLTHLEILYYTVSDLKDDRASEVRTSSPNAVGMNLPERHEELAELTGNLEEDLGWWSLS
ncbi:MAG: hypothetical protein ABEJ91_04360 [Candidatus Nanohaloarchaea archaeon]